MENADGITYEIIVVDNGSSMVVILVFRMDTDAAAIRVRKALERETNDPNAMAVVRQNGKDVAALLCEAKGRQADAAIYDFPLACRVMESYLKRRLPRLARLGSQ